MKYFDFFIRFFFNPLLIPPKKVVGIPLDSLENLFRFSPDSPTEYKDYYLGLPKDKRPYLCAGQRGGCIFVMLSDNTCFTKKFY